MTQLWLRIGAVLFISGFCSLVYQVTWLRMLRQVFGASTAASGAVVAIFMGGLGLGGWFFGRRLRRVDRPLAFYANLELGIGLAAALTPILILAARSVYLAAGGAEGLGTTVATVARLGLSVLVLGAATTLMGGTLPAVAQAMKRSGDLGRRDVAWLYGFNTLGAVTGAFLATFFLIELFGIRQTLWLGCLFNLLLAIYVRQLARETEGAATEGADTETSVRDAPEVTPETESRGPLSERARWVLPAAAAVGFVFFLMEIVWYRLLAPILGGSSYTFGLILTLALLGIGLGGLLYAIGSVHRRPTFADFALTCALEAFFLILPFFIGDGVAWLAMASRALSAVGFTGLVASWTLVGGFIVLPASVIAGYQFPLLVALLGSREKLGYEVGLTYAWNTGGAIVGSLAGGFGLLPLLTAPHLWWMSAAFLAVLAMVAIALDRRLEDGPPTRWRLGVPIGVALLSLWMCAAEGPTVFWRHSPIGAGRVKAEVKDRNELRKILHHRRFSLLTEAEGRESSIALFRDQDLSLFVNGKSDGSARGDAPTQVMSGLAAAMLHPNPQDMMVIGLGTGSTAGWLAAIPSAHRVDVAELEPAVIDLAEAFAPVNQDVLNSPKVEIFRGDGREFVLGTDRTYDLIFSEPSNPYRAGISNLFSQDFYVALVERLRPNGLFLQWLQGYDVDAELVQTVFSTMSSVFPHIEVWQVHNLDFLLIASMDPIEHDLARVRQLATEEPYRTGLLRAWGVEGAEGLYSGYLAGPNLARALYASGGGEVSSDDRPRVEFSFARNVGRGLLLHPESLLEMATMLGVDRPPVEGLDWELVKDYRHVRSVFDTGRLSETEFRNATGDQKWRFLARGAYGNEQLEGAREFWFEQDDTAPRLFHDTLLVAEVLADVGDPVAETFIAQIAPDGPVEAAAIEARLAARLGDVETAFEALLRCFRTAREDAWFHQPIVVRAMRLAEEISQGRPDVASALFEALSEPFAVHLLEIDRLHARVAIAGSLEPQSRCAEGFAPFEPHVPWEEQFLAARAACYEQAAHPLTAEAFDQLALYRAQGAPKFRLMEEALGPLLAPGPAAVSPAGEPPTLPALPDAAPSSVEEPGADAAPES